MQLTPGAMIGGKYRLERPLASGGMGSVWVALHTDLDVEVAIKFIQDNYASSPMLRARFEREARASAKISSAHVVHVLDYGLEGDTPFFAMELLAVGTLSRQFNERLHQPLEQLVPAHPVLVKVFVHFVNVTGLPQVHQPVNAVDQGD